MTVCRCALFNRRADVSAEDFRLHWLGLHAALASQPPGLGSYRQNHIVERLHEDPRSPVQAMDGIAQLSFPSVAAKEVSASPEYAACKRDIAKFQGGIPILVIEADELLAGAGGPAKLLRVSTRRASANAEGLRERWSAAHRESARFDDAHAARAAFASPAGRGLLFEDAGARRRLPRRGSEDRLMHLARRDPS